MQHRHTLRIPYAGFAMRRYSAPIAGTITDAAFANIYGLEFVYVAKGCSPDIGWAVFGPTDSLKEVIIPKDVSHIEDETFDGCNEIVMFAPAGSYAAKYGRKSFIQVDSSRYEQMADYYKSIYGV